SASPDRASSRREERRKTRELVAGLFVDQLQKRQTFGIAPHVLGKVINEADLTVGAPSRGMRAHDYVGAVENRMFWSRRFSGKYIQAGTGNPTFLERPDQRHVVEKRAPRHRNKIRRPLHVSKNLFIEHAFGLWSMGRCGY